MAVRRILVPMDGSDNAARALDYALKLAKADKQIEICLVTVQPEPVVYGEVQLYISKEQWAEILKKQSEEILQPAEEAAKKAGVPFKSEILVGDTASAIAKHADKLDCDSIVMGTRGMGAIGNLVLGSVATKVVHLTKRPVTLIK